MVKLNHESFTPAHFSWALLDGVAIWDAWAWAGRGMYGPQNMPLCARTSVEGEKFAAFRGMLQREFPPQPKNFIFKVKFSLLCKWKGFSASVPPLLAHCWLLKSSKFYWNSYQSQSFIAFSPSFPAPCLSCSVRNQKSLPPNALSGQFIVLRGGGIRVEP